MKLKRIISRAKILMRIVKWRLTWSIYDLDYKDNSVKNPKFLTAKEAMKLIPDDACVVSSGMAGNTRCQIFFWGVKDRFLAEGHPKNLTWITVGAQGSRGRVPGTIEELAIPGLITHYIAGHAETAKALLKHVDNGHCDLRVMPQGQLVFSFEAQVLGKDYVTAKAGIGTFLDPRIGCGSNVIDGKGEQMVSVDGDKLRYTLPKVTVSLFTMPAADEEGNLYSYNSCMFTESYESAMAAKKNGGIVLVSVAEIIPKCEKDIFLRSEYIDAIIINPRNEQTGSVPQIKPWDALTLKNVDDPEEMIDSLRFVNQVLKITPQRDAAMQALSRLGADLFAEVAAKKPLVNIGVGLAEEVCRLIYESKLEAEVTFSTEVGTSGGMPAPGIFFGAEVNPKEMISSAQMFHRYYEKLDMALFGLLQVDSDGNVNVSKRGKGAWNYVGPGGFPDIAAAADTIIFIGTWMTKADIEIKDSKMLITKPGQVKFMDKVDEITLSGQEALKAGKQLYYVTHVGVFHLKKRGMTLIKVMPGIDIQKDIIKSSSMKIVLPENGKVEMIDSSIVTGKSFVLERKSVK